MTNYERIKSMNIEEMAACFSKFSQCDNCIAEGFCNKINNRDDETVRMSCEQRFEEFLESEVKEMSDKNLNEWLFADIDDLIDYDYSDESEAETRMADNEIFGTEIKCINRRANGKCNGGTDCCKCDLLMNEKDIISAYERAIANSNLINRLQAEIERLTPTADVAKVVRCKDCKHYEFSTACCKHFCNEYGGFVTENDYCSRAEKSNGIIREV